MREDLDKLKAELDGLDLAEADEILFKALSQKTEELAEFIRKVRIYNSLQGFECPEEPEGNRFKDSTDI